MSAADRLSRLDIDMAAWEERGQGWKRVTFSPEFWPAVITLVREAEAEHRKQRQDRKYHHYAADCRLCAALAALNKAVE